MNAKKLVPICAVLSVLVGCLTDKEANRGSVVDNEVRVGTLYLADGQPAANARVRLFPVDHVPDSSSPAFSTRTDEDGKYTVDSMGSGEYNILGELEGEYSYQDSVFLSSSTGSIPPDTLDEPGSLQGIIGLQPGDDPRTATVQVLGTNSFSNVDVDGRFKLANLGSGKYTLRILTTLPEYTPLFAGVNVLSGGEDSLGDTLRLAFTGIPAVTGIRAEFDTVQGVARITWDPVAFPSFQSYFVYRDSGGALDIAKTRINKSRLSRPVYLDTLYRSANDTLPGNWEYRIAVQDLNGRQGKVFNMAELEAVPPLTAKTRITFQVPAAHGDTVSIRDTVKIIASFDNPAYANRHIEWKELNDPDILRATTLDAHSGTDTLTWLVPALPGPRAVTAQLTDAAGRVWKDTLNLTVALDQPSADAGRDTAVGYGTAFTLHGKAMNRFGAIAKWEWQIGRSGEFMRTRTGDTTIILPEDPDSTFLCVLRITDDDELSDLDTIRLDIRRSWVAGSLLTPQVPEFNLIVASYPLDGKIITILDSLGKVTLESFDPLTGKSVIVSRTTLIGGYRTSAIAGEKLFLAGSFAMSSGENVPNTLYSYDFQTGLWRTEITWENSETEPRPDFEMVGFGDQVFAFEERGAIYEYNSMNKAWLWKIDTHGNFFGMTLCVGDGKIYGITSKLFGFYDPATNTWNPLDSLSSTYRPGLGWANGNLYVFGGSSQNHSPGRLVNAVNIYDPSRNAWSSGGLLLYATFHPGVAFSGGLFYVSGVSNFAIDIPTPPAEAIERDFIQAYKP